MRRKFERSVLALKMEDVIRAKAKRRQIEAGEDKKSVEYKNRLSKILDKRSDKIDGRTDTELAKIADTSNATIYKVRNIEEKANAEIKQKLNTGEISINQAYKRDSVCREEEKDFREFSKIRPTKESLEISLTIKTDLIFPNIWKNFMW